MDLNSEPRRLEESDLCQPPILFKLSLDLDFIYSLV